MTTMERARKWQRVSTGDQDEEKQLADLDRWVIEHGYADDGSYVVHGKSAFKGRHIPDLDRALAEMEAGQYTVLVVWDTSRIWRGKSVAKDLALMERADDSGGRIEFVKDSYLNVDPGVPRWVRDQMRAQALGMAYAESQRKSELTARDQKQKREHGAAFGRPSFGYRVTGKKDGKKFVPTDTGRKYVPIIYKKVIDGETLRAIARYLDSEGVPTATGGPGGSGSTSPA